MPSSLFSCVSIQLLTQAEVHVSRAWTIGTLPP